MTSSSESGDQLDALLAEVLTRADNGESPDLQAYLSQYPQHADKLGEFFSDMRFVAERIASDRAAGGSGSQLTHLRLPGTGHDGDPSAVPRVPVIEGFRALEEIGAGSQGVVYKAEQIGMRRMVALKIMRMGAYATESERRRFQNEIEYASKLKHPCIVGLYECGTTDGHDYFAMEYVEGAPLDDHVIENLSGTRDIVTLFVQVCDAVSFAHQQGVIHRDLKPSNIIVDVKGEPRILDFGLAKPVQGEPLDERSAITRVGEFAGTWCYASPEQAGRNPSLVDVRSDVYALGVILFELLTKTFPYPIQSASREAIAKHIMESPPRRPSAIRPDIESDLETIILRTLEKSPQRRYQSADALSQDLQRFLAGEAIEAKRDSSWYVLRKTLRRHRSRVALATTALAALLGFAITVSVLYSQALTARATTEIRSGIVRKSQAYLIEMLDELNWKSNRLQRIVDAHPELEEVRAAQRPTHDDPLPLFSSVLADMPRGVLGSVRSGEYAFSDAFLDWMDAKESQFVEIENLSRTVRFAFRVVPNPESDVSLASSPGDIGRVREICEVLAARAVRNWRDGRHDAAVTSFSAARSVAFDLGDGRLPHHKTMSILARLAVYRAILLVFNESRADASSVERYIEWMLHDPPLVEYRLAMIATRQKCSQYLEGSIVARSATDPGALDLDTLDRLALKVYETRGVAQNTNSVDLSKVTPNDALKALDTFIRELQTWDERPFDELNQHAREIYATQSDHAREVVLRSLPDLREGFKVRGRVNATRAAAMLSARLWMYRLEVGRWPSRLNEAVHDDKRFLPIDPYVGRAFGYRLEKGRPVLYSLNEDGQDNAGTSGQWGDPETDVVLFSPQAP